MLIACQGPFRSDVGCDWDGPRVECLGTPMGVTEFAPDAMSSWT